MTTASPRARPTAAATVRRAAAVTVPTLLLAALAVLLGAPPASAHARFLGSDPAEGATLAELPAAVVMTYSEEIAPQFVETAVITPGGETLPTPADAEGPDVTVDLSGSDVTAQADQAGRWQVVARVVSVDGHPVEHTTSFTLDAPVAAPAEPAEPTAAQTGPTGPTGADAGSTEAPATEEPASAPAAPTTPDADPVSTLSDEVPAWAGVLVALLLAAAAATALVVQLRRRPPTG